MNCNGLDNPVIRREVAITICATSVAVILAILIVMFNAVMATVRTRNAVTFYPVDDWSSRVERLDLPKEEG